MAALMNSVATFGFITPVIVDEGGLLLCGHARVAAAKNLGIDTVPTVCARHLSEARKRAFILADNRLAQLAAWDEDALKRELEFLSDLQIDFDFSAIGFDTAEVSFILDRNTTASTRRQRKRKPTGASAVSQPGDIWRLGDHFVCCGLAGLAEIDAMIRRWQADSGGDAVDARSGERFDARQPLNAAHEIAKSTAPQ
jgi:hypothetical protein